MVRNYNRRSKPKLCKDCANWEKCDKGWSRDQNCTVPESFQEFIYPNACPTACTHLTVTEEEQTRLFQNGLRVPHLCKKYKQTLNHGRFENGELERIEGCSE